MPKNIEGKNEQQLKIKEKKQLEAIKNIKTDLKLPKMISFFSTLSPEAKEKQNKTKNKLLDKLKEGKKHNQFLKNCLCEI